jgi:hypothetical protein
MNLRISRLLVIVTVLTVASLAPRSGRAASPTLETLHSFCSQSNCSDGAGPGAYAGLIMDGAGNLYGTTSGGGANSGGAFAGGNGGGTVFQLTRSGTGWRENVLYSFCSQLVGQDCTDGVTPYAGLIMDASGNLYGTTFSGGATIYGGGFGSGVVFELTPNQSKTAWTETVLYNFCSQPLCTDGTGAVGSLIMDGAGNLYGTTRQGGGGLSGGGGVVFELTPDHSKATWTETVLYSFCSQSSCADGLYPYGRLIMDGAGNLYGTTSAGGANGGATGGAGGAVFELTPNQSKTAWTETVLYSFCSQTDCTDGEHPFAGLIMDGAGNLYGTTVAGGFNFVGTAFQLAKTGTAWSEKVLHSFCTEVVGNDCADGVYPYAGLIMDGAGNLYGTTFGGGTGLYNGSGIGSGVGFELTPNQSKTAWTETVLYNFCSQSNCADGFSPQAGLIADGAGNLYGTTGLGGNNVSPCPGIGCGTVFEITGSGFVAPVLLPPNEVAARASGLAYSRVSQTFNGTVTITNISTGAISGPFQILFTGLTAGVMLVNATGDFSGSPYLTISVSDLAPGQSATASVRFKDPSSGKINFSPVIYSGSI